MRLLIDGIVFDKGFGALAAAKFWNGMVPMLAERFRGAEIYFLNRGSAIQFQDIPSIHHLYAPAINPDATALEFYRLAALCREYDITAFLSTCGTSAGNQVKSVFIEPVMTAVDFPEAEAKSYKLAAQLATVRITVHEEGMRRIAGLTDIPPENMFCLYPAGTETVSATVIANWIAKQFLQISTSGHSRPDYLSIMAQKEIGNEYSCNPQAVYDPAGWKNYLGYMDYVRQITQNQQQQ